MDIIKHADLASAPEAGDQENMVFVKVRDNESIEEALRRFKRECERNGILKEIKRREHYLTPSVKRKLKQQETLRKLRRLRRKRSARSA